MHPLCLSRKIVLLDWEDFTTLEHITCLSKLAVSQPNPNTASRIFFGTFPNLFRNHPAGCCTHTTLTQFISWYQYTKAIFSKYSSGYTPCRPEPKGRCLQYADGALLDLSECLVLQYQSRIRHTKVLFWLFSSAAHTAMPEGLWDLLGRYTIFVEGSWLPFWGDWLCMMAHCVKY